MPARASPKREREYKELESRFKKEHRYQGREAEVASRIVNKQRAKFGETKDAQQQEQRGRAPDRGLPLEDYRHMTIAQVENHLPQLSLAQIRKIRSYEAAHKNRKSLLQKLDRRLQRH